MALQTRVGKAAAKAAVDAIVDLLDVGAGTKAQVELWSGSQPASPDVATPTGTKLATIDLETTAFGAATTDTGVYIKADCASLPNTTTSATATGTAAFFRAVDQGGNAIISGDVGSTTTTADMSIDNTSIVAGQTVKLNSWKVRFPYK